MLNLLLNQKPSYRAYFPTVFVFLLLFSIQPSFADETFNDVIILFDQSASMNDYDPKLASKVWMLTFIKTFEKPYNVFLVGFDDRLHEHAKATMAISGDVDSLRDKVKSIKTRGLTTDMEVPLRYLLERNAINPIAFAVIISDGEPEIWDDKRWYLSKKIRTDLRYEELNRQYRTFKARGFTNKQLYNRLKDLYQAKNLNYINERLGELKELVGEKLVFMDISGDFKYFKNWAKAANAQHILVDAVNEENLVESLRGAIISLQKKASKILSEQLPSDHEERIEPIPKPKAIKNPKPGIPVRPPIQAKPPPASPKIAPPTKKNIKATDKEELSERWKTLLPVILLLAAALLIFRKKTTPPGEGLKAQKTQKDKTYTNQTLEQVKAKLNKISVTSIKDAKKFIENEIQMTFNDTDKELLKLLDTEKEKFGSDKRGFLRIPLNSDTMIIYWKNKNGECHYGNAINISLKGVMFEAADFDDGRIDTIKCPKMGITFHIERSRVIRNEAGQVVAALDEFRYDIDERIKWIETLTRIGEEK